MNYKTVTASTVVPVTVDFLKKQLRITGTDMDDYLLSLLKAATQSANDFTGRQLNRATLMAYCQYKGVYLYEVERGPVITIDKVEFINESSEVITLVAGDYTLVKEELSAMIFITATEKLVSISRTRPDAVQITYTAGYTGGTGSLFPESVINAIAMKAARMFTNPDDAVDEKYSISENLLRSYRCPII